MSKRPREPGGAIREKRWVGASPLATGLALCAALVALAGGRVALPAAAGSPASVTYALCTSNLELFQLLPPRRPGEPFAIAAQLDRAATQELARLTEANVGQVLDVVVGEWRFVRGPIRSTLRSGLLVNAAFARRAEAEAWLARLQSDLPEAPCGSDA